MKAVLVLFLCCFSVFNNAQNEAIFEEGNTLYNQGKYAEAVDKYEVLLKSDKESAALYFNLGNAHYKLNNIAPSIFYYEKAKLLKPSDKEIQNNLSFAQNMTIDAIDKVPEVGFSRLFNNLINRFSADTWAKIAVGGVLLFVLLFLFYHFAYATTQKRIAFVISLFSIILSLFSVIMAFQKSSLEKKNNPAIVFAQETRVKADPNKTSEELFRLHEGTKVQVLEAYNNWYKIEIADKTTGWIPSEDIKTLRNLSF
ncbi:MAG: tetratricopeptide repeat protein [Winogradskyella sp.]|uniref:tetratricopeptide repeat protein n=1 Tax=Winogradskyella sp. TaxID=1883156 RepID=UPI00178F2F10|nr:tetratricopeptide repeat protein [Winogradskyella sp.]MBT8246103.1 tetratricopeptide repeat protein [Winogradskyella sp.]NNK22993.1 tetratricopeptide repeat protein [Winogradskyella sp.]